MTSEQKMPDGGDLADAARPHALGRHGRLRAHQQRGDPPNSRGGSNSCLWLARRTGLPGVEVAQPIFSELEADVQALVVEHRVRYLAPLNYRNVPAVIRIWISAVKGASFTVAYGIFDPVTESKCVIAETVLAFFHEPSGTLVRLTAANKAQLEKLRGPANFKA
ncbi:acyl-CoA thioesterase [Arthrobacter psychrolactophilus]